jgi:hypothetical protein
MVKIVKNINTEIGGYLISDKDIFEKPISVGLYKLPIGKYNVVISVKPVTGMFKDKCNIKKGIITVTSGEVFIGDPCIIYPRQTEWMKFIIKHSDFKKIKNGLFIDVGGDGIGEVSVNFERIA